MLCHPSAWLSSWSLGVMQLREAIARLSEWSEMATIFASRIAGEFRPESEAVVLELSESELARPVFEVAAERVPGMEYFLEIFIALEVVDGLRISQQHQKPSLEQIVERIIYYAEHRVGANADQPRRLSGLPLEFVDGLSYTTIIEFAEPFAGRRVPQWWDLDR